MKEKPQLESPGQIVLGVVVIGLGLLFLLDNLNLIDVRYAFRFWPTIIMLFGVLKIMQSRSTGAYIVGGALVLFGLALTLKYLGLIYISWKTLWPLLLIALGFSIVLRSLRGRRRTRRAAQGGVAGAPVSLDKLDKKAADDDSEVEVTAILGGYVRRIGAQDFRGGEVTAILGGCELDLRNAAIRGEAVLNVFVMCGGITIKVPPDWSVVLQGTPILGGFDEKTIVPPDASQRLIVRGYAIMGGLEVRN
ncbi:LiaI-LiaF-like domain-containing protein [Janthinobacterium agaricidamnosum]|uniref:LiaF transmembrane domain-containing protein n=1 Tax=Janthinobacterium agaricidamnosum NBRC 102515 = DSM 9628 TaxID=1349767 RepID=W0V8T3_9BURK|nr:DUF5668 domain-containing protein [Janthinobacterium agaricidamnosum]CDG83763.1 hypothetical protein GJA_3140 [Janthinobacterium agaricidamnosum NBRC 102515 = DSM 9628]